MSFHVGLLMWGLHSAWFRQLAHLTTAPTPRQPVSINIPVSPPGDWYPWGCRDLSVRLGSRTGPHRHRVVVEVHWRGARWLVGWLVIEVEQLFSVLKQWTTAVPVRALSRTKGWRSIYWVVVTFNYVGGSFNMFLAITGYVWIIPSFRICDYVLHVEHV